MLVLVVGGPERVQVPLIPSPELVLVLVLLELPSWH